MTCSGPGGPGQEAAQAGLDRACVRSADLKTYPRGEHGLPARLDGSITSLLSECSSLMPCTATLTDSGYSWQISFRLSHYVAGRSGGAGICFPSPFLPLDGRVPGVAHKLEERGRGIVMGPCTRQEKLGLTLSLRA